MVADGEGQRTHFGLVPFSDRRGKVVASEEVVETGSIGNNVRCNGQTIGTKSHKTHCTNVRYTYA
jgi:hypothetical protein